MWLVCDGHVLAAAEEPSGVRGRMRGLLGRDGIDGVMVLPRCRNVHTFGMRFPIDVAFCDRDGVVIRAVTMPPRRISPMVWRAQTVLEAEAGALERWGVQVGDRLELRV